VKTVDPALEAYLQSIQNSPDADMFTADCYTITLQTGLEIQVTSADVDIQIGSDVYLSDSIMVQNLVYKSSVGLDADQQSVTLLYNDSDTIGGISVAACAANGILSGARIERLIAYFSDHVGGSLVGTVVGYRGRVMSVDSCGSSSAEITVSNSLVVLENDMPRNIFSAGCNHVLFDAGCGLDKSLFVTSAVVGAGSGSRYIFTPLANVSMIGGYVEFATGPCAGLRATIKNATNGARLDLLFIPVTDPDPGDSIRIYPGCDHSPDECSTKFSNLQNFRGFSYVPPPQYAQ
jgi:uncharacterized phage protein (TIGR02218 family)